MKMMQQVLVLMALICAVLSPRPAFSQNTGPDANVVYLKDLVPMEYENKSADEVRASWKPMKASLNGQVFENSALIGFILGQPLATGQYMNSFKFFIQRQYSTFDAYVGILDSYPDEKQTARFRVKVDDKEVFVSKPLGPLDKPEHISISVQGAMRLEIQTEGPHWNSFSRVWGDAKLIKGNPPPPPPPPCPNPPCPGTRETFGTKVLRIEPSSLRELATDFKAQMLDDAELSKTKPTLAVAAFKLIPQEQLAASNADNVREDLSTALIKTKAFEVVERGQLDQALRELKIGLSDTFDSEKAQQLGKLVSARLVLIGSISDRGTYVVINARLIDTQTGKVNIASSIEARQ